MRVIEIFIIAIGLAMDAFAVAVGKGLCLKDTKWTISIGLCFGVFQALMSWLGYISGRVIGMAITNISGYIAFGLLLIVGVNMVRESSSNDCTENIEKLNFISMIILGVATSIDAFTIGITFAFFELKIVQAILIIGIITFLLSIIGVKIGNVFGSRYEKSAQILGGIILIIIGLKSLIEQIGII